MIPEELKEVCKEAYDDCIKPYKQVLAILLFWAIVGILSLAFLF